MIHQLVAALSAHDAIGNIARLYQAILREAGQRDSHIYTLSHDARAPGGLDARDLRLGPDDWLIYHYGNASAATAIAERLGDRVILHDHNVTPGRFFQRYSADMAGRLERGRVEEARFGAQPALTDSHFNRGELLAMGFRDPRVIPPWVDADGLRRSAASPAGRAIQQRHPRIINNERWTNWLFVGRLAPNKRQDDLITAFADYQRRHQPNSRLLLVGAAHGNRAYHSELDYHVARSGAQQVVFAGQPGFDEGFGGWYAAADVFVSASEHEGFGIPLVEAMAFGLPIVARACAAVPEAVRGAGLLIARPEPAALAEGVHLLLTDEPARAALLRRQPDRLAAHSRAVVAATLLRELRAITGQP
ncbi:MAG: glycosyltransferase family 4 protein [Thermoflexales bacterium]|nr:glycosyltransferase family 4 protein [Thermoflexales bacterium]